MSDEKIDHKALWNDLEQAVLSRRWDAIRNSWVEIIPPIGTAGVAPNPTLSDFLSSSDLFAEGEPRKGELTQITYPRGEVPELIFREALYWMHKAVHVLGASESSINSGLPTWSLSSAYQSGFFAARAVMGFLGIAVGEIERVSVVVDLARDLRGIRPGRVQELGGFENNMRLASLGVLFDHRQIWLLFQRILRMTSRTPWLDSWSSFFVNLDIGEFTRQRHGLHYELAYWVMQDMHSFVFAEEFRDVQPSGSGRDLFSLEEDNFTLVLGFTLTRMALDLFHNLARSTNRLIAERDLLDKVVITERHPLFADSLRNSAAAA